MSTPSPEPPRSSTAPNATTFIDRADQLADVATAGTVNDFARRLDLEAKTAPRRRRHRPPRAPASQRPSTILGRPRRHVEPVSQVRPRHRCAHRRTHRHHDPDPLRRSRPDSTAPTTPSRNSATSPPRPSPTNSSLLDDTDETRPPPPRQNPSTWPSSTPTHPATTAPSPSSRSPSRSPPASSPSSPATPTSTPSSSATASCSTHPANSTWAAPPDWPTGPNDGRCGALPALCDPRLHRRLRPLQTPPHHLVAQRRPHRSGQPAARCARATTPRSTTTAGSSNSDPTANSPSRLPDGTIHTTGPPGRRQPAA